MSSLTKLKEKYQTELEFNTSLLKKNTPELLLLGLTETFSLECLKIAEKRENFKESVKEIIQEYLIDRMPKSIHHTPVENVKWTIEYIKELNINFSLSKKIEWMLNLKDYRAKLFLFTEIEPQLSQATVLTEPNYTELIKKAFSSEDKFINFDLLFELPKFNQIMKYGSSESESPNALLIALMTYNKFDDSFKLINQIKDLGIKIEDCQMSKLTYFIHSVINLSVMTDDNASKTIKFLSEINDPLLFNSSYEYAKELFDCYLTTLTSDEQYKMIEFEQKYLEFSISINQENNNTKKIKL
jgi:hypothetical protein